METFQQLMARLSAIDLNAWIALAAIIVAALVAYHIAGAQGVFRKARLSARFSPQDRPEPAVMIFNLRGRERRSQVVTVHFFLQNLGRVPVIDIAMQFGLYPRRDIENLKEQFGPMYRESFPRDPVRVTAVEDRDVLEFKVPVLAPDEGYVIVLPYLITRDSDRTGKLSGIVTLDLHYAQGRKIRKALFVCIVSDIEVTDDRQRRKVVQTFDV